MTLAFILISTKPRKEHEVYNELMKIPEILELHPLFGDYDLIARVEVPDLDALSELVVHKIRAIDGISDTKTLTGSKF
jgi:DNA-binding Lrp family transcriptional regulator